MSYLSVLFRSLVFLLTTSALILATSANLQAQLTGTLNIPGNYATISDAVNALNSQGVGPGGVIIEVAAGHTETAPLGGIILGSATLNDGGASSSVNRPVTIRKKGTGANPLITAFVGTGTTDGIFKIAGADYVTIDGIDLKENPANTTSVQQMEWGYALVKRNATAPFDGCQNVTIRNCTITMVKDSFRVVGIYSGNHIATATTALTLSSTTDAHNNIRITGNTIRNVMSGIVLTGATNNSSYYDQNAIIDSNTIENFGVNVITTIPGNPQTTSGIYLAYQNNATVRANTINNIAGGGKANVRVSLHGIYHHTATDAKATISDNDITIICDSAGNVPIFYGIRSTISGTVAPSLTITNNTICLQGGLSGANNSLIHHIGALLDLDITNNTFKNVRFTGVQGTFIHVANNTLVNGSVKIRNNKTSGLAFINPHGTNFASPNNVYGINLSGNADASTRDTITGNEFAITHMASAVGTVFYGINDDHGYASAPYPIKFITNNIFGPIDSLGTTGIRTKKLGYAGDAISVISNNRISHVNAFIAGISVENAAGQRAVIHNNLIDSSYNNSTDNTATYTHGIVIRGGEKFEIFNNRIQDLEIKKPLTSVRSIHGMGLLDFDTAVVYNNMITGLRTENVNTDTGLVGLKILGVKDARVYHNTIHFSSTNTMPSFGAAGVLYGDNVNNIDLRNNIIHVDAEAGIDGYVSAVRRTSGTASTRPANFDTNSNGNVYYVRDAANTFIYAEGIAPNPIINEFSLSNDPAFNSGCGAYREFMTPSENRTFTENNLSLNADGLYTPSGAAFAKELAVATTHPAIDNDLSGSPRPAPADAGALQFTGIPKSEGGQLGIRTDQNTELCSGDTMLLYAPSIPGATYTWLRDGQVIANASADSLFVSESGDYQVQLTFPGCDDTSASLSVIVHPLPQPIITDNNGTLSTETFASYQWYHNEEPINGATNQSFTPTEPGNYTVKVVDNNGCESKAASVTVDVATYTEDAFAIYPNPAQNTIYIRNVAPIITMMSIDGTTILKTEHASRVNIEHIPTGCYIVVITDRDGHILHREKLIKQ